MKITTHLIKVTLKYFCLAKPVGYNVFSHLGLNTGLSTKHCTNDVHLYHQTEVSNYTPFEVTLGLEPRMVQNPNPDLRRQHWEYISTEVFQRLHECPYINSYLKPTDLKTENYVLLKDHIFFKNKLAETFKGPFRITKVHENVTALIRSKTAKHDSLANTNLLVK
jgi:hypothetical protein